MALFWHRTDDDLFCLPAPLIILHVIPRCLIYTHTNVGFHKTERCVKKLKVQTHYKPSHTERSEESNLFNGSSQYIGRALHNFLHLNKTRVIDNYTISGRNVGKHTFANYIIVNIPAQDIKANVVLVNNL